MELVRERLALAPSRRLGCSWPRSLTAASPVRVIPLNEELIKAAAQRQPDAAGIAPGYSPTASARDLVVLQWDPKRAAPGASLSHLANEFLKPSEATPYGYTNAVEGSGSWAAHLRKTKEAAGHPMAVRWSPGTVA